MTVFFNSLTDAYLGFAAIFACIGFGFLFFRKAAGGEAGPGFWSACFFLNGAGFLFWSGVVPLVPFRFFLIGEVLHVLGFFALVGGVYRFTGCEFRRWNAAALAVWAVVWLGSIALIGTYTFAASFLLKAIRGVLFVWAGHMILVRVAVKSLAGRRLAGWSLVVWGIYVMAFSVVRLPPGSSSVHVAYGFLGGFQTLAALGMVVMIVDRMRLRAEESEHLAERLEGLLPICSYCKRIRDDSGAWQNMESYISKRSDAEFSHGICPDCAKKHFPEFESTTKDAAKKP